MRPAAEAIAAAQERANLARYNDRFDSGRQQIDLTNQLQPRGRVQVDIQIPHTPPPADTTGPSPYEQEKAQEDAWE
ncbi:MAG: hypothetical protein E6R03_13855 [Hyphomicrobiaceae bacterium]|nr:MAG: hypothetical protein E6R03_13855 [Hyphomicrobiaceae bacterium]